MKKTREEKEKELVDYIKNNVIMFEPRYDVALDAVNRMRCPLSSADSSLFDTMQERLEEWCEENEEDPENYDLDELF